jgi:hypothetical protein
MIARRPRFDARRDGFDVAPQVRASITAIGDAEPHFSFARAGCLEPSIERRHRRM